MKKITTIALILATFLAAHPLSISAQTAKKYVLLEHFTNSECATCAANNPGFFSNIAVESNKNVHHVSFHPSTPYSDCALYLANTAEQNARASYYSISGVPRVSINGASTVNVNAVSSTQITTEAAKTSPISVVVSETTGATRTATVTIKRNATVAAGTYKVYGAIVEKKVNYKGTRTNESVHYNVFRKWAKSLTIDAYDAAGNATQTYTFSYSVDAKWDAAQTYVLAYVQEVTTREILNSGTQSDVLAATDEPSIDAQVRISPNPTSGKVNINFDGVTPQYLTVLNSIGQILETATDLKSTNYALDLSKYQQGVYFIKIQSKEGSAVKKVVRQ